VAAAGAIIAVVYISVLSGTPISPEELERRVTASRPTWESYQEDIKAQIGARPVAEWEGRPLRASLEGGALQIAFAVEGVWATRKFAVPVLVRDPSGNVFRSADATHIGAKTGYTFLLPNSLDPVTLGWVEVRYPGNVKRLVPEMGG